MRNALQAIGEKRAELDALTYCDGSGGLSY